MDPTTRPSGAATAAFCDPAEVARAVRLIVAPGAVTEVRILDARASPADDWPKTLSGYFDDPAKLAAEVAQVRCAVGAYLTVNEVDPALLARSANRLQKAPKGSATSDNHIGRRRWLLIDCDAVRPAGISSTDAEHWAAIKRAEAVELFLHDLGWPDPIRADSGNGCHLLYRIELPADDGGLVERMLTSLAAEFDDDQVSIDTAVHNAARICRLYGTRACKGDDTPDRPHRMSSIIVAPDVPQIVPVELLADLAGPAPEAKPAAKINGQAHNGALPTFDVAAFLTRHNLDVRGPDTWIGKQGTGQKWTFTTSPLCEHHDDGPHIEQHASGAITAGCPHKSCSWTWADLRGHFEPLHGYNNRTMPAQPRVDASIKNLARITPLAWDALQTANNPPTLFRHGGLATRVELGDDGEPKITPLDFHRMRHHLARAAEWIETRRVGDSQVERAVAPPKDVVNDLLASPDISLPTLTRIVEAPVFAPDGTLQTEAGYHARGKVYYVPAPGFIVPDVPAQPTGLDVESARDVLCDELLGDFPFVSDAEKAHAVALLLLPFSRDLIDGPTPLHLIEKPTPGTGATLMVDAIASPSIGRPLPTLTEGRDEDEWRKRITAKLSSGSPHVFIDNLRRRLDSAAVASAITSPTWEDRILGVSAVIKIPVKTIWVASGNNPGLSSEISRRTIRIRLDARVDRPWMRNGFRNADLRAWAREHRGLLVWSALTLIRAWIVAGRPPGEQTLGMFESWARTMGGILKVAGIPGMLSNLDDFYTESDAEGQTWREFMTAWWDRHQGSDVKVADLWTIATGDVGLSLGDRGEQSQKILLGKMLSEKRDRMFDLEIEGKPVRLTVRRGGTSRRATLWNLQEV